MLRPFCWKCASKITESNGNGSSSLVGCKEDENIHNYSDAEKLCSLMKDKMSKKMIIVVSGGVAEIFNKPDDMEVEIRDYDIEDSDEPEYRPDCEKDDEGKWYQCMNFPPLDIDKVLIGWQPDIKEFPIAGLTVLEVYENLEMGKGCHPEVKNWVKICDNEYATYIIIPYDRKNEKKMQFNVCGTCGAKDGRAGNLFGEKDSDLFECRNCHNTRKNGKVFIDTSLSRTKEEIKKTMAILN